MRRAVLAAGFLLSLELLFASPGHAMWAGMRLESVVTQSDLIVIATLGSTRTYVHAGMDVVDGALVVERVIWGDVAPGDTLLLRWQNYPNVACPRVENGQYSNQSRVWFLTRTVDGVVHADHPNRVMPPEDVTAVIDTMRAYPYQVITPSFDPAQPVHFDIVFRNATDRVIEIPTIRVADAGMSYSDGFEFRPQLPEANWAPRTERTFQRDSTLAKTSLAPGESRRVRIPFSDLVGELAPARYRFDLTVNDRTLSNSVLVRSEYLSRLERVRNTPDEVRFHVQTLRSSPKDPNGALMMLRLNPRETTRVAPELMALCDSLEGWPRVEMIRIIASLDIDIETRLDFVLDRIDDADPRIRGQAAWSVRSLLQDSRLSHRRLDAGNELLRLLDDEDPGVRQAAVHAMGGADPFVALPALERLLRYDVSPEVREAARRAMDRLEGRDPCTGQSRRAD